MLLTRQTFVHHTTPTTFDVLSDFVLIDIDAARPMDKPSILNLLEWVGKDENIFTSILLFISFLNTELAHVAQLIVRRRQGPSYITWPVP